MRYKVCTFNYEIKTGSDEKGIVEGYGSIFDNEPDSYGDIIEKGCFAESISKGGRNKNGIPMLFNHSASSPIGTWTELIEDNIGLKVKGKLALGSTTADDAYIWMQNKTVQGLSIGYVIKREEIDSERDIRILKQVDLWEISLVTFPAKISANVLNVKNLEECLNERDLENALRESGLSKNAAQYLIKLCRPQLRESIGEEQKLQSLLAGIKQAREVYFK